MRDENIVNVEKDLAKSGSSVTLSTGRVVEPHIHPWATMSWSGSLF